MRKSLLPEALAFVAITLATVPAFGQSPPPPDGQPAGPPVSVPSGPGSAIITPGDKPAEAPKPGQPTMPRPLNYTPPDYPPEAQKAGIEGSVTLQLDISKEGKVLKVVVIEPAGHGFDESATAAANKLQFDPARRADGTAFAARILYRYSFTLKKAEPPPDTATGDGTTAAAKQSAENFRGTVLLVGTDVPLAGATVTLSGPAGLRKSVVASATGAFAFEGLPNGVYKVEITANGYEPVNVEETLSATEVTEVKYRLSPKGGPLEVVIRGERPPREVTKRTLEQREIARIPGTNGDALRSIQNLPGVARPPGLAGLLIVRGSAPQDTQTFIDGTPVPLIYHFGGLSSVVPTEMLEKIDFYPGNFSAQYGRVMGGIVDAGLRGPKDDGQYHGLGQFDLIDARAMIEGPVPFLKKWRFAAAGRRSYVDVVLGPVIKATAGPGTSAPVYYDYQFMLETNPTALSRFRVTFFGSDDSLHLLIAKPSASEPALSGNFDLHTAFKRVQARYNQDFENGDKLSAVAAFGQDNIGIDLGPFFFVLDLNSITGRIEYTHRFAKGVTLNTGLDIFGGFYTTHLHLPAIVPGQPPNGPFSTRPVQDVQNKGSAAQPAAYMELELAPSSRFKLVPGVRVDYFTINKQWDVSPRVNARYDIHPEFPRTTAKGGIGFYHQQPQFQEVAPPLGNPKVESERAIHYSLGLEQEITRRIEGSLEGFYKQLDNQVVGTPAASATTTTYTNAGTGYVVGAEVLLKYKPDERFFGWLAYTLSRSIRRDGPGEPEHLVPYDQTHILTILGSYQLGNGWEFGARFRLISGNLSTPYVCNSASSSCTPNRVNSIYDASAGVYVPIPFGSYASERMPMFHALDLRIDKRWKFKRWQLSWYLDVQNVYNHLNVEGIGYNFNYTARDYIGGLPILPSVGLRGDF